MSAHTHREHVEGCFRCDLSQEEAREHEEYPMPATDDVRSDYAASGHLYPEVDERAARAFDRWHAEEIRKAKAEALRSFAAGVESRFEDQGLTRDDLIKTTPGFIAGIAEEAAKQIEPHP